MARRDADEQNRLAVGEWSNRTALSGSLNLHATTLILASRGSNSRGALNFRRRNILEVSAYPVQNLPRDKLLIFWLGC